MTMAVRVARRWNRLEGSCKQVLRSKNGQPKLTLFSIKPTMWQMDERPIHSAAAALSAAVSSISHETGKKVTATVTKAESSPLCGILCRKDWASVCRLLIPRTHLHVPWDNLSAIHAHTQTARQHCLLTCKHAGHRNVWWTPTHVQEDIRHVAAHKRRRPAVGTRRACSRGRTRSLDNWKAAKPSAAASM